MGRDLYPKPARVKLSPVEILFVASEVAPFSKTGGLADVAAALPKALGARGHRVTVVSPRYGSIDRTKFGIPAPARSVEVPGGAAGIAVLPGPPGVRYFFVEHDDLFGFRPGLYGEAGEDYGDNPARFAFLCRVAVHLPGEFRFAPQVVHLHDWQTGLSAFLLREARRYDEALVRAKSVFTVHNLAHQGNFAKEWITWLGLPWEAFHTDGLEFWDQLSFMKAGLACSDALTTVSPTYAREILGPEAGNSMDGLLMKRRASLLGILNGIDLEEWNPETDRHLPARYSARRLRGKAACKEALQREVGLPVNADVPLVGMIGRLAHQKGLDLVEAALARMLELDAQYVVLGSGEPHWEEMFAAAAQRRPDRLARVVGFHEGLAHRIEAGADLFLMPSLYEPCGLTQMYSLRYGAVPIVRRVGGLADTVRDWDGRTGGNGFVFEDYRADAMLTALKRALVAFRDRATFEALRLTGMAEDNGWDRSAARYEALYASLGAGPR
jgi:starch synthase